MLRNRFWRTLSFMIRKPQTGTKHFLQNTSAERCVSGTARVSGAVCLAQTPPDCTYKVPRDGSISFFGRKPESQEQF